jgi:hypothetical protein
LELAVTVHNAGAFSIRATIAFPQRADGDAVMITSLEKLALIPLQSEQAS